MDTGQFPATCPACRAEAAGDAEKLRTGRVTDATLTFLQRRGVFDAEFQFRFSLQAFRDRGEAFFRCPADDCGNWLLAAPPGDIVEIRGDQVTREKKIGLAPCGAAVCLVCHAEIPRYVAALKKGTKQPGVGDSVRAFSDGDRPWSRAIVTSRKASGVVVKWLRRASGGRDVLDSNNKHATFVEWSNLEVEAAPKSPASDDPFPENIHVVAAASPRPVPTTTRFHGRSTP